MNFDELDKKMRRFEQSLDQTVLPELYMAARIDGRNFTRLTKELCQFEVPFDTHFRDIMVSTVLHLFECGFRFVYGFTESDEISLLFHPNDNTFGRKTRKLNSILAGEASSAFSLKLGVPACFDCRIIPLPTLECVKDYFSWRQEDAHRNALNSYCYWTLRKEGKSALEATKLLQGASVSEKNELLFSRGINFNEIPEWQKRGVGVYYTSFEKTGWNPIEKKETQTIRRQLTIDYHLSLGADYAGWVISFL